MDEPVTSNPGGSHELRVDYCAEDGAWIVSRFEVVEPEIDPEAEKVWRPADPR